MVVLSVARTSWLIAEVLATPVVATAAEADGLEAVEVPDSGAMALLLTLKKSLFYIVLLVGMIGSPSPTTLLWQCTLMPVLPIIL